MNIALGTVFLFILVIPGLTFRSAFFFGPRTKKPAKLTAFDDFIRAIVPGLTFQLIGSLIINASPEFWGYKVDFISIAKILFPNEKTDGAVNAITSTTANLGHVLLYQAILISLAGFIGFVIRKIIDLYHLDHRFTFLRFNNEWYYFLRGETNFFYPTYSSLIEVGDEKLKRWEKFCKLHERRKKKIDEIKRDRQLVTKFCLANIVTKLDGEKRLVFKGIVKHFYLLPDGQIDTIWLTKVRRSELLVTPPSWTTIPVETLAIKGCEIIDIAISLPEANEIKEVVFDPKTEIETEAPSLLISKKPRIIIPKGTKLNRLWLDRKHKR